MMITYLSAPLTYAKNQLSANVGATSNYLWRGLEQTNGKAAISGGLDYNMSSGFYAGTWVSNADWSDGMSYELDLYAGYAAQISEIDYSVGVIYYAYPDSDADVDFSEINASLSYGMFTLSYSVLAHADGSDFTDDSYLAADINFNVLTDAEINLHLGAGLDDFYAGESYIDYGVSFSKLGFTLGVSNTNLSDSDVKAYISYSIALEFLSKAQQCISELGY
ncbi:hypothetical protein EMK97_00340 [Litorilituus sediminis]|uniref:Porin n=2 Tax=Litorilituus sediminis TaxID=718192 RepID=A0A4P6P7Z5_9GAMM|nr:hypothetical protein EMK97_00340 [Litorilituus sediminis]